MNINQLQAKRTELLETLKKGEHDPAPMSADKLQWLDNEIQIIEGKIFKLNKIESYGIGRRFSTASVDDFKDTKVVTLVDGKKSNLFEFAENYSSDFMNTGFNGQSIIITGSVGVGKTHLACALAIAGRETVFLKRRTNEDFDLAFVTASDLAAHFVSRNFHADEAITNYAKVDFLIIDDMAAEISDGDKGLWVNEQVINRVIRPRYNACLPTIITTNTKLEEFYEMYGERASTIFQGNSYVSVLMYSDKDLRSKVENDN